MDIEVPEDDHSDAPIDDSCSDTEDEPPPLISDSDDDAPQGPVDETGPFEDDIAGRVGARPGHHELDT
eukprot:5314850-Lingulodinium_polyedra.AAC.1